MRKPPNPIIKWNTYSNKISTGYLDWYFCDPKSVEFAIRDVTIRKKFEPHYEDGTFNFCKSCNQRFLKKSLEDGVSHIFFFTKYCGKIAQFRNKYYITGFFEIGKTSLVDVTKPRIAIKAKTQHFYKIKDSLELSKIIGKDIQNARYAPKRLNERQTQKILEHFADKIDCTKEYSSFTSSIEIQN
jgi:hypothetical protein